MENFNLKGAKTQLLKEIEKSKYPQEVQDILEDLMGVLPIKKYQLKAFSNYGVWFIELPFTAIHSGNLKRIESVLPNFMIGVYPGYSGLSLRTDISVK
jgi:hypothetical protein